MMGDNDSLEIVDFYEAKDFLQSLEIKKRKSLGKNMYLVTGENLLSSDMDLEDLALFQDTIENTNLFLKTKKEVFPVGKSAISSLLSCCDIHGAIFKQFSAREICSILNKCLKHKTNFIHFAIIGDKIRSFSAIEKEYDFLLNQQDFQKLKFSFSRISVTYSDSFGEKTNSYWI